MQGFVGEIRAFAFPFAPQGWAACNGQTLPIAQNTSLFALFGTSFGGNGQTTFGLPTLNGVVPVGAGAGPGRSPWTLGQSQGTSTVTLIESQMAAHNHGLVASGNTATVRAATGNQLALSATGDIDNAVDALIYVNANANVLFSPQTLQAAGSGNGHNNMMPSLVVNYCICLGGTFPDFG